MPIHDSQCLMPQGQQVALWAVETLQRALGADFLQRAAASPTFHHRVFSFGLWPANDVPWVYANLLQLAVQIELLNRPGARLRQVKRSMSRNLESINWIHSLLQLEIAGLGLRVGWQSVFEPDLGNGRQADVELSNGLLRLIVETTSMRMSDTEQDALAFFRRLSEQIEHLAWLHPVRITGSLGNPLSPQDEALWLQQIETAISATIQDGTTHLVSGSAGGQIEIARDATMPGTVHLEGAPVTADIWGRLIARLNDKNDQAAGGGPIWVRLDEYAGLWQFTPLQGMTLPEKLDSLAPALQEELASFPNLAGIILSPTVWWAGDAPLEVLSERIERNGGIALRSPIPGHRVRESLFVSQAGQAHENVRIFADWYEQEATWLDWALEQLGHPPFHALVQDYQEKSGR